MALLWDSFLNFSVAVGEVLELERYTDSIEGFTLLRPSSWIKESTKEAEVVAVSERTGKGGLQVYEFEYKVDSTRGGLKRILSAAFVASGKLYLLNIAHSDGLESPIDSDRRNMLEQILHSFDIASSI
ncbi:unnamed protein product [Withania somnifera]